MIHSILKHFTSNQQYGIVSLCLFFFVFIGVLIWAFLLKKSHLEYMSRVALDAEPNELQNPKDSHE